MAIITCLVSSLLGAVCAAEIGTCSSAEFDADGNCPGDNADLIGVSLLQARTTLGHKITVSSPRRLSEVMLQGRLRNRFQRFWSMSISNTGREAQVKSTSKLQQDPCGGYPGAVCGEEGDPLSCVNLCGPSCMQWDPSVAPADAACLTSFMEHNCMACHDCVADNAAAKGHGKGKGKDDNPCPECGDGSDPATCLNVVNADQVNPPCSDQTINDPACVASFTEHGCMVCHDCVADFLTDHAAAKGHGKGKGKDDNPCPTCGDASNPASCLSVVNADQVNPPCSDQTINDPACVASFMEHGCMACHECVAPLIADDAGAAASPATLLGLPRHRFQRFWSTNKVKRSAHFFKQVNSFAHFFQK